jgi:RHS repeat-associated protein
MGAVPALQADTQYHYDSFGRIQSLGYPDGHSVFYEYDHGGNVSRVYGKHGPDTVEYVSRINYDAQGRRTRMRRANGVETRYSYDAAMERLTAVDSNHLPSSTAIQALRYYYTNTGNIRWLDNVLPSSTPGPRTGTIYQDFFYDEREQLTQAYATRYWDTDAQRRYSYSLTYDGIGNITQRQQEVSYRLGWSNPWVTEPNLTRNDSYQYTSSRPHAFTQIGGTTGHHDANGNLAETRLAADNSLIASNSWDHLNRLQSVVNGIAQVYHHYDAAGERTHRDGPGSVTQYANGYYSLRNGAISTRHIFVSGERIASTVGEVGTLHEGIQTYHFHTDHLQSVQYITDATGSVREHLEYLPFGEPWIQEDNIPSEVAYRFTGKEHDDETGLTYFGARYYDSRTAQWISPDPILASYLRGTPVGGVFDPRNLSFFAYAWNSPSSHNDPDGRSPAVVGRAVVGGVALLGGTAAATHYAGRYSRSHSTQDAVATVAWTAVAVTGAALLWNTAWSEPALATAAPAGAGLLAQGRQLLENAGQRAQQLSGMAQRLFSVGNGPGGGFSFEEVHVASPLNLPRHIAVFNLSTGQGRFHSGMGAHSNVAYSPLDAAGRTLPSMIRGMGDVLVGFEIRAGSLVTGGTSGVNNSPIPHALLGRFTQMVNAAGVRIAEGTMFFTRDENGIIYNVFRAGAWQGIRR